MWQDEDAHAPRSGRKTLLRSLSLELGTIDALVLGTYKHVRWQAPIKCGFNRITLLAVMMLGNEECRGINLFVRAAG